MILHFVISLHFYLLSLENVSKNYEKKGVFNTFRRVLNYARLFEYKFSVILLD